MKAADYQDRWLPAANWVAQESGKAIQRAVVARREAPCVWAEFHHRMLTALPGRALLRRAWHRMMRRRMAAQCKARGGPCRED